MTSSTPPSRETVMPTPAHAAFAATNTFRVRDPAALRAALEPHGALITTHSACRVRVSFPTGLPAEAPTRDGGQISAVDVPALIAAQLDAEGIAVLKEIRALPGTIRARILYRRA